MIDLLRIIRNLTPGDLAVAAGSAGYSAHLAYQAADTALRKCEHLRMEIVKLEIAALQQKTSPAETDGASEGET